MGKTEEPRAIVDAGPLIHLTNLHARSTLHIARRLLAEIVARVTEG